MSRELFIDGIKLEKYSGSGTVAVADCKATLTNYVWGYYNKYIEINPTGHTYQYDVVFDAPSGSQLYIGIERFDKDKTSTSNNSCVYIYSGTTARTKYRIKGTVDLSKDSSGNATKYIRLRILNNWNSATSNYTSIFYSISLREVDSITQPLVSKSGIVTCDLYRSNDGDVEFDKNGFIVSNELKEI